MKQNFPLLSLVPIFVFGVAGCTVSRPLIKPDGRSGYVTDLYSVQRLNADTPKCLKGLPPEQLSTGGFVEVQISHYRSYRNVSAIVPPGLKLTLHDKVEVSPADCKDGKIPVIQQILSKPK
jgi:hypothetical protein